MAQNILVLGATGTVGGAVVRRLAEDNSVRVFAAVRNLEKGAFPDGVERRYLPYDEPESYAAAFAEIDRLFVIAPAIYEHDIVSEFKQLIDAAQHAGVRHIVASTALGITYAPDSDLFKIEQHIRDTAPRFTFLRPNFYSQNYVTYDYQALQHGVIALPANEGTASNIDVRDIAEVAAQALTSEAHYGKEYELTGPDALTQTQIAEIISEVSGRAIQYTNPSSEEYKQTLQSYGMSAHAAEHMDGVYAMIR